MGKGDILSENVRKVLILIVPLRRNLSNFFNINMVYSVKKDEKKRLRKIRRPTIESKLS